MKKIIASLMTLAMLLSLAACNTSSEGGASSDATSDAGTSATESTVSTESTGSGYTPGTEINTNITVNAVNPPQADHDVDFTEVLPAGDSKVKDLDGDGVIRVACMGDSITEGNEGSNWPYFLQQYLDYLGTIDGNTYEVKNYGKAGTAVHRVLEEIDGNEDGSIDPNGEYYLYDSPRYVESLTYAADLVIVQHGANDGLGGNAAELENYFISDYANYLIKPYLDNGAKVVIATPTYADNGVVDPYVNGWISEAVRAMANEYGLQYVDLNKITQPRPESFPDGIHGNASGYQLIAQTYMNQIFGAELATVTFNTEATATVEMGTHMTTANSKGVATLYLLKGFETGEFDLKISCANFKAVNETITVSETVSLDYPLTAGSFNVAVGATVSASSYHAENNNPPENAVDNDQTTRWESEYKDGQWFIVDLGEVKKINGVNIYWEGAYASNYKIEISTDGENYEEVADVTISKEALESTTFDDVDARYVRIDCVTRSNTKFGCSFYEIQVLSDEAE